jgi:hypothetical protein
MSGSDYNSPVDEPPGKDGHQGQANPDEVFPVPEWPPGANPVGTNPPVDPPVDPATVPVPGSVPGVVLGEAPSAPPENIDVPHVSQSGDTLSCTMGNWVGTPDSYAYLWTIAGVEADTGAASTYVVIAGDAGGTASCVVTATNALGSTAAPPSNSVVIAAPAAA